MSVTNLVIDVETLKTVSGSIKTYVNEAVNNLEEAIRGLQVAQAQWYDEDMEELIDSLQAFVTEVETIGEKGLVLSERCEQKIQALARLHSMKI